MCDVRRDPGQRSRRTRWIQAAGGFTSGCRRIRRDRGKEIGGPYAGTSRTMFVMADVGGRPPARTLPLRTKASYIRPGPMRIFFLMATRTRGSSRNAAALNGGGPRPAHRLKSSDAIDQLFDRRLAGRRLKRRANVPAIAIHPCAMNHPCSPDYAHIVKVKLECAVRPTVTVAVPIHRGSRSVDGPLGLEQIPLYP